MKPSTSLIPSAGRRSIQIALAFVAVVFGAVGCSRETPVSTPGTGTPEEIRLGALAYRLTVTAGDEVVVDVDGQYVDGAVFIDDREAGRFAKSGGSFEASARVVLDPAKPSHTLLLHLHRAGDEAVYRYDIIGYRHRFAETFAEEKLVGFDGNLYDFSLSPDRDALFYVVQGNLGPPRELHSVDLASGVDRIVEPFFNGTTIRALSATRLVTPSPAPASTAGDDRALLNLYDVTTRDYEPKWEVSQSYLRLTQVVDGYLVANRPYFDNGPSGMIINLGDESVTRVAMDFRLLRQHTVDHIWLGNAVLDPQQAVFVMVPNGDVPNFIAYLFSDDGRTVAGVEMKSAVALYERQVVVYHDGTRVFDEGRNFRSKNVHGVEGSFEDDRFFMYQSDLLSTESAQRTANGFYRIDRRTGDPVLVHTAPASIEDYQVAPGIILSRRPDGFYRLTER